MTGAMILGLLLLAALIFGGRTLFQPRAASKFTTTLVCGATGVGKSTLINAMSGKPDAQTGIGAPVTRNTSRIEVPELELAFYDSRGMEVQEAGHTYLLLLSDLLRLRYHQDATQQIDLVLMCIAEPSARFDDSHKEIANLCEDLQIPLGIALTKAEGNDEFYSIVRREFSAAAFVLSVRALPLQLGSIQIPAEGVPALLELVRENAVRDLDKGRERARYSRKTAQMAETAHDLVGRQSDVAWRDLAGAAYTLLLGQSTGNWKAWLYEAREQVKKQLVPSMVKRYFDTDFDRARIDGELSQRVLARILRGFCRGQRELLQADLRETFAEVLAQLRERRPYRSRF